MAADAFADHRGTAGLEHPEYVLITIFLAITVFLEKTAETT